MYLAGYDLFVILLIIAGIVIFFTPKLREYFGDSDTWVGILLNYHHNIHEELTNSWSIAIAQSVLFIIYMVVISVISFILGLFWPLLIVVLVFTIIFRIFK